MVAHRCQSKVKNEIKKNKKRQKNKNREKTKYYFIKTKPCTRSIIAKMTTSAQFPKNGFFDPLQT